MQPDMQIIVGRNLQRADWQKAAGHLSGMVERGWASLWPSKLSCPTSAALHQIWNTDLLKRYKAESLTFTEAVQESQMLDPKTNDTLLLFEAGHFWERVIADAIVEEYGERHGEDGELIGGRNVRIEDEESLISGEIDVLTPGPHDSLVAWEIKSTKAYAISNFGPSESHIVQLYLYTYLWNLRNEQKITEAYLVYTPNDKHPSTVLKKMKVIGLGDARRERGLTTADIIGRLELAQQYTRECSLANPPPPSQDGMQWPCSKKSGREPACVWYDFCFSSGAKEGVWDIPF